MDMQKPKPIALPPNPGGAPITLIVPFGRGGRVAWDYARNQIVFDGQLTQYQVWPYLCNPDGSGITPLSLPVDMPFNVGNPAVSQQGDKILLQVALDSGGTNVNPGVGQFNDIYLGVYNAPAVTSWTKLTNVGLMGGSVLHPKFSPDGSKIAWTQTVGSNLAQWEIVIANADGSNQKMYKPGNHGFYELGSWSYDNVSVAVACSDQRSPGGAYKNGYLFNPLTGAFFNLTNTKSQWMEFPQYAATGRLAYVSTVNTGVAVTTALYPLDVWTAEPNGAFPVRETFFNMVNGQYLVKIADLEWNKDGSMLVALAYYMGPGPTGQPERAEGLVTIMPLPV